MRRKNQRERPGCFDCNKFLQCFTNKGNSIVVTGGGISITQVMDMDIPPNLKEYHLFSQSFGHTADVRDVAGLFGDTFASCSRDGTIKVWHNVGGTYETKKTLTGHTNVNKMGISALLFIKPGIHPIFKDGCLASAGYDKAICVWDIPALTGDETNPTLNLWGHDQAPTCLSVSAEGNILSGGSDNIGRVWRGNRCVQELRGHRFPIWSIIGLANGDIVTGSGDRNIKIWRGGECIKTLATHKDAVRGLTDVPGVGFLSSSNDGTICLWTYDGLLLQTMQGHEGFIYKVISLPSGEFASASEDGTVKLWKDNECIQTLVHPSGLWSVSVLENGDIVTAGQDGVIRVWSRDPNRTASDDLLAVFTQEIADKHKSMDVGDLKLDQLPGPEALLVPGTKEAQHLMINRDGKGHIYAWSIERKTWDYIGEIQGAKDDKNANSDNKKVVNGVQYDFAFDVDLGDGSPNRQLLFNLGEDPYRAAQYFIEVQQLEQYYLDEIAKFIMKNVPNWMDAPHKQFYRPESGKPPPSSSAPSEGGSTKIPASNSNNFPQCKPVLFDGGNFENILSKIKSFNEELAGQEATTTLALNSNEWIQVESVFTKVSQTSRYHTSNFTQKEYSAIERLLSWPPKNLFPVIDLLRLMALHPEAANHWTSSGMVSKLITAGLNKQDAHPANVMLTFKFVANLFMLPTVRRKMFTYQEQLLENITDTFTEANKNTKLALSTTLLNFSVLYLMEPNEEGVTQTISVISEALNAPNNDVEIQFRLLVALGTLIYLSKERQSLASDLGIPDVLDGLLNSANEKVKLCATEIKAFFK